MSEQPFDPERSRAIDDAQIRKEAYAERQQAWRAMLAGLRSIGASEPAAPERAQDEGQVAA